MLASAAAVATGTESATAVGSPGQAALASAFNNGQGVSPGSPITSSANAIGNNAPAYASSISGRKLKQVMYASNGCMLAPAVHVIKHSHIPA